MMDETRPSPFFALFHFRVLSSLPLHSELVPDKSMLCVGPEEENLAFYPTEQ